MGHEHVDSLKETKPTPSQERVGEDAKLEQMRNGANGQTNDANSDVGTQGPLKVSCANVGTQEPLKVTHADMAKRGNQNKPESVRGRSNASAVLTF